MFNKIKPLECHGKYYELAARTFDLHFSLYVNLNNLEVRVNGYKYIHIIILYTDNGLYHYIELGEAKTRVKERYMSGRRGQNDLFAHAPRR